MEPAALEKLKTSRSRYAGWVTQAIKKYESSVNKSPTVLQLLKTRIVSQLTKLQDAQDAYVECLAEEEVNDAEEWMEGYFERASKALEEIDMKLQTPNAIDSAHETKPMKESEVIESPSVQKVPEVKVSNPESAPGSSLDSTDEPGATDASSTDTVNSGPTSAARLSEVSIGGNPDDSSRDVRNVRQSSQSNSIDSWIDDLEIGVETTFMVISGSQDVAEALAKLEIERDLPKIELPTFDGSPLTWPRFVEQFYVQVHSRRGLNDCRRMDLLQSHVRGEAKRLIEGLGYSARNYAMSLKELKFAFGHRVAVARAYVNNITGGNVIQPGDSIALRNFYIAVRDCIAVLHQMSYTSEISSSDVLQRASRRIPPDKRVKWNDFIRNVSRSREPKLSDLEGWLKDCVESEFNPYAISARTSKSQSSLSHSNNRASVVNTMKSSSDRTDGRTCPLCSSDHHLSRCKDYLDKSQEQRYELVKSLRLCFNCLGDKHRIADCTSSVVCRVSGCKVKHHTSLHRSRPRSDQGSSSSSVSHGRVNNLQGKSSRVYFQVLPVIVQGNNGRQLTTYALLDSASDITMISEDLAWDLGLKGIQDTLSVSTLNSTTSIPSRRVSFTIRAELEPDAHSLRVKEAWTKPGFFNCPPVQATDLQGLPHLRGINLVDINSADVKVLIGANVPKAHMQIDVRDGKCDSPVAIKTVLGWCVMGSSVMSSDSASAHVNLVTSEHNLSEQIEQFWKTESFGVSASFQKPISIEDQRASHYLQSETKLVDGRYEVPMLWRERTSVLPNNRSQAEKRFSYLTQRLSADPGLQEKYVAVVNGYINKGYARQLNPIEAAAVSDKTWYLPHHGVTNVNKPGKVRVVYDAAATYGGVSLNDQLMSGPDLTTSLFSVIQRFRMKPVAIVADVEEMFHQVRVPESDSDALRFLWKQDLNEQGPPQVYKMLVHIFGAKDSPCCVNFALQQAVSHADVTVKETVLRNFYVDDMLKAVDDIPSANTLIHSLSSVLADHGFRLTKWLSPRREVLIDLPQSSDAAIDFDMDLEQLPVQRALGLAWKVQNDCFVFNPVVKDVVMTKRSFISAISSIFDPCGFLTPFSFRAKCLMQDVWRANLEWDDIVPEDLRQRWTAWYAELPLLRNLHIPRYHGCTADMKLELHVFCDASESGFASVAYLRMVDDAGVRCSFLASRSHVAPLKPRLTIPKLELQGAVMAVRLANALQEAIDVKTVMFWTDAITVLRYISNEERRWKIFVANRVAEIREHTHSSQWRYVPSSQNPADDGTRGLPADKMIAESRWFQGPLFLYYGEDGWPPQPEIGAPQSEDDELRRKPARVQNAQMTTRDPAFEFHMRSLISPEEYSSWSKLLHRTSWLLRAVRNFLSSVRPAIITVRTAHLTVSEVEDAEVVLARIAQMENFASEYKLLRDAGDLGEKSCLRPLSPFFDTAKNVIRVGGRLHRAPELEAKHQIVLPCDHPVTRLIVTDVHLRQAHCGPEHLIATLRQRFWPLKCRQTVKKAIHKCMDCRKRTAKPVVPLMAELPSQRIAGYTRPFQHTGLDYFGPFIAKRARSRVKRWGCLFTCLVTRAVHLELADSLLTDDFIMVLRCFMSRRGPPAEIYSDNGTNFRGAEAELNANLNQLDHDQINNFLLQKRTAWHFIPPHAPHFGGVWESLVKSTKRALKAILKEQIVSESVLRTTLSEVEAVINSRPLTYNSTDITDYTALTPNHFLHGGATEVSPPGTFPAQDISSRKRWRQCQVLADQVWHRWLKEYLPSLTVRNHWQHEQRNLHVNDLVLLMDENAPRGQWHLGRIVEVFPSLDDRVRSVKVKTAHGEYHRPSARICLLEEGCD